MRIKHILQIMPQATSVSKVSLKEFKLPKKETKLCIMTVNAFVLKGHPEGLRCVQPLKLIPKPPKNTKKFAIKKALAKTILIQVQQSNLTARTITLVTLQLAVYYTYSK